MERTLAPGRRVGAAVFLREYGLIFAIAAITLVATAIRPAFLSGGNIMNILRAYSTIGIASIGMAFAIIGGGMDLSIDSTISLSSVITMMIINATTTPDRVTPAYAAVELAATRITEQEIEELEQVHTGYVGDDYEACVRYISENRTFHYKIALASGNEALAEIIGHLHDRLMRFFVKKYTLKRGAMALGKMLPVGIGAVVGGVGNRLIGKKIIGNAQKAFGPPPPRWPTTLRVLPSARS